VACSSANCACSSAIVAIMQSAAFMLICSAMV